MSYSDSCFTWPDLIFKATGELTVWQTGSTLATTWKSLRSHPRVLITKQTQKPWKAILLIKPAVNYADQLQHYPHLFIVLWLTVQNRHLSAASQPSHHMLCALYGLNQHTALRLHDGFPCAFESTSLKTALWCSYNTFTGLCCSLTAWCAVTNELGSEAQTGLALQCGFFIHILIPALVSVWCVSKVNN